MLGFHDGDGITYNITKCVRLHREAGELEMNHLREMPSKDMIQMMFLIWMSQASFSEPSTHTKMHYSSLETKLL